MEFPNQEPSTVRGSGFQPLRPFDMRDWLEPRRMTAVMWDHTFLTRHVPGDSFADYDRVLDEVVERGYNTLRLDPLPQTIDLSRPETVYGQAPMGLPYLPWTRPEGFSGPAGEWLIEFVEKARDRGLYYCLSSWWGSGITPLNGGAHPRDFAEGARCWIRFLEQWQHRFGFEGCAYVDLNNEFPCFFPGLGDELQEAEKEDPQNGKRRWFESTINDALALMRKAFPELKFTVSLHGNVEYADWELELDCMDIHFYADADPRWVQRTRFYDFCSGGMFKQDDWHAEFSDRCARAHRAGAALYRARQRAKVAAFAGMGQQRGIPLLTTESWASWYYIDSPHLDWGWLLEWAAWSVEDAIDFGMWGWTPHNYAQPQFENWKSVEWHRRLTDRFLNSRGFAEEQSERAYPPDFAAAGVRPGHGL